MEFIPAAGLLTVSTVQSVSLGSRYHTQVSECTEEPYSGIVCYASHALSMRQTPSLHHGVTERTRLPVLRTCVYDTVYSVHLLCTWHGHRTEIAHPSYSSRRLTTARGIDSLVPSAKPFPDSTSPISPHIGRPMSRQSVLRREQKTAMWLLTCIPYSVK